jgi:hypothetical protein
MPVREEVRGRGRGAHDGEVEEEREKPQNITITVRADGTVDDDQVEVYRNDVQEHSDRIRWNNQAARGVTIAFQDWPFVEAPRDIQIEAGKMSEWFHVYLTTSVAGYFYSIDPPLSIGPPGEPKIEVEG